MKILINIAFQSLLSRKITVFLTIISLTISIVLFLSIDTLRLGAKKSFFGNVKSGDLILGARSGEVQLLLYSLFQIGSPTNNISWESYQQISKMPEIDWIIPISLGDSHKQFRVMGTTKKYFEKFSYRKDKKLQFQSGTYFKDTFDVVIGSDVAEILNYKLDDNIIIAHGIASQSLHDEFPFKIKGILKKTGTSTDKLVLVSLEALEAIHKNWKAGIRLPNYKPKNLKKDIKILKKLKVDYLFVPSVNEIYKDKKSKKIHLKNKDKIMCALHRPGHFEGVLAVINQFLKNIKPKFMFLGEKDYQQFFLIKKFIKNRFKTKIKECKTVRLNNLVPYSSRNFLLSRNDINKASLVSKSIYKFYSSIKKDLNNKLNINKIKTNINSKKIKIDYLEIRNKINLSKNYNRKNFKIFIAYYLKDIRLIDNF